MSSESSETFRANLKRVLAAFGITQTQIAETLSMGAPSISRVLSGLENVTLQRADRLCEYLGVDLAAMIGGTPIVLPLERADCLRANVSDWPIGLLAEHAGLPKNLVSQLLVSNAPILLNQAEQIAKAVDTPLHVLCSGRIPVTS